MVWIRIPIRNTDHNVPEYGSSLDPEPKHCLDINLSDTVIPLLQRGPHKMVKTGMASDNIMLHLRPEDIKLLYQEFSDS